MILKRHCWRAEISRMLLRRMRMHTLARVSKSRRARPRNRQTIRNEIRSVGGGDRIHVASCGVDSGGDSGDVQKVVSAIVQTAMATAVAAEGSWWRRWTDGSGGGLLVALARW